ncbi:hypothetical protein CDN98_19055 [Roseateles terrae]|nr:hypothetical protein CDN98_19055 [Roseateles terrae]
MRPTRRLPLRPLHLTPLAASQRNRPWRWRLVAGLAFAGVLGLPAAAQAQSFGLCERSQAVSAADQDLILRFTALVVRELEASGAGTALVSRAGTDLSRFGLRYSHAGMALKDNPAGAWSVRQLYYVCDESRPRLFDQGLAAFLLAGRSAGTHVVSIVTLPASARAAEQQLHDRVRDAPTALSLLSPRYSANAYAFGLTYQNCNQWIAEMMAAAWDPSFAVPELSATGYNREHAQRWLRSAGYAPTDIQVGSHGLMFIGQWIPLLHMDDHPLEDLYALRLRVSLPGALEAFLQQQVPAAQRVELCLRDRQVVVHRGWSPLGEDCRPVDAQDEVRTLD